MQFFTAEISRPDRLCTVARLLSADIRNLPGSSLPCVHYPNIHVRRNLCRSSGKKRAFDDGVITIGTDKERHSGRYTLTETDGGNTALYEIDFGEETGRMTSGITQYGDGAREGTLIITVGEYVVTFRASLAD